MKTLGDYEDLIFSNFYNNGIGLDFSKFSRTFAYDIKIDLKAITLLDFEKLTTEINPIIKFVEKCHLRGLNRPLWIKINVVDKAVNDHVGIGFLKLETEWLKFVVDYLNRDRADESGDTIFAIFDVNFSWAICFTLSQDDKTLQVEKFDQ